MKANEPGFPIKLLKGYHTLLVLHNIQKNYARKNNRDIHNNTHQIIWFVFKKWILCGGQIVGLALFNKLFRFIKNKIFLWYPLHWTVTNTKLRLSVKLLDMTYPQWYDPTAMFWASRIRYMQTIWRNDGQWQK